MFWKSLGFCVAAWAPAHASAESGPQAGGADAAQATSTRQPRVLPGIDVLLTDSAHLIAGLRLGLITNRAAVDAESVSTIDRLSSFPADPPSRFPRPRLVALFAPEHGVRGDYDPGESVRDTAMGAGDTVDLATGLPIYSLYGPRRAPTREQLMALDVLLVDLQDVGTRTFTFISTTIHAMRAARAAGKRVIVLDRPNPIGCVMQGPVLDPAYASFIGMLRVPLRHGMTIGELALLANEELDIGADLVVVPVHGWRRCMWFHETGLPWAQPSPNLPTIESVALYPGTVLFEATNLSVGRGTDAPFRQIGAPWVDLSRWERLPALEDTVSFTPRRPGDGKYGGIPVHGVRLAQALLTGDPIESAVRLLLRFHDAYPDSLRIDTLGVAQRLGVAFDPQCTSGRCIVEDMLRVWPIGIERFRERARRYFLYP